LTDLCTQNELDAKAVYPKMVDLATGEVQQT